MNAPNEFDDIARRKLDEREFAFDEAQWSAVESSLRSGRERSRRIIWFFAFAALLIAGLGTWWALRGGSRASIAEASPTTRVEQQTDGDHGNVAAPITNEVGATDPSSTAQPSTVRGTSASEPTTGSTKDNDGVGRDLPQKHAEPVKSGTPRARVADVSARVNVGIAVHHRPNAKSKWSSGSADEHALGATNEHKNEVAAKGSATSNGSTASIAEPANGSDGSSMATSGNMPATSTVPLPSAGDTGAVAVPISPNTVIAYSDNTSTGSHNTNDTAFAPPAPQQIALAPAKTWRLEFGLLAGGFNTRSQYSGITSANWESDVYSASSPGFGAELMTMGAHFGFGTGIHYSNYAERIRSNELNANEQVYSTSYSLMPVQAHLMVIVSTDTILGVVHYVTGQLDTTINTLTSHTDTTNVTVLKRQSREFVNTVSYVEIPLLLDAHTRSGHWNFGVRAGPTIGFLTSRRGSLPNAELDGYSDLSTEQFNSTVFGYTARIYVRYALGPAWAIGIEPTVKGQLTSTLAQGDLTRKSSALGAFLSVTYRLP